MADRIPERHLVLIAAAATAAISTLAKESNPKWKHPSKIRIRIPIVIRPRKAEEPKPGRGEPAKGVLV